MHILWVLHKAKVMSRGCSTNSIAKDKLGGGSQLYLSYPVQSIEDKLVYLPNCPRISECKSNHKGLHLGPKVVPKNKWELLQHMGEGVKIYGLVAACANQERIQKESKPSGRRTHHPRRGTKGVKTFGKSQDPREDGHTIQEGVQRESRALGRRTHYPTPRRTP